MKLDLTELYALQDKLDMVVANKGHDLESYHSIESRIFAFHTEVHELANEISFFKYWKEGHKQDRGRILDEIVDCIHFLLSISLTKKYTKVIKSVYAFELWEDYPIEEMFYTLRKNNLDSMGQVGMAFSLVLGIARKLGFELEDIEKGYRRKNEVNHVRQRDGY